MSGDGRPGALDNLSPEANEVYDVLDSEGPLIRGEIVEYADMSKAVFQKVIGRLEDRGVVKHGVCLDDTRKREYRLADQEPKRAPSPGGASDDG